MLISSRLARFFQVE